MSQLKIVGMSLAGVAVTFVVFHILRTYLPPAPESPIDYACEALASTPKSLPEPVGMAYRGKLNTYQIMVGSVEINITEFVNKKAEHCMLASRNGEIDLICENH